MVLKEKKVEYIELIYDLIFVYLIGRSNSMLEHIEGGFISAATFISYLISSLIIIQIWSYTTVFVNRFGENGLAENLMMFFNMFMLYIMGSNTILGWNENYGAYMGAWIMILLCMALQYVLKLRKVETSCARSLIGRTIAIFIIQAVFIGVSIPVFYSSGAALGQYAVLIGIVATPAVTIHMQAPVNFEHLTERVMLYVVFTFGEMIVMVAGYFSNGITVSSMIYGLLSFLTVAGLFFSYGYVYNNLLDRKKEDTGSLYVFLHVFLIISLSCITTALDFMRNSEVMALPKTLFLTVSLLVFFVCLAFTEHWSVRRIGGRRRFFMIIAAESAVYVTAMLLSRNSGYALGIVTVVFIFAQLITLMLSEKYTSKR